MQKPKFKIQIFIFLEFWVVFTVLSFVGNPVYSWSAAFSSSQGKKVRKKGNSRKKKAIKINHLTRFKVHKLCHEQINVRKSLINLEQIY